MNNWNKQIADMLADGTVALVIGYEEGSTPQKTRPLFCHDAAAAERLVMDGR